MNTGTKLTKELFQDFYKSPLNDETVERSTFPFPILLENKRQAEPPENPASNVQWKQTCDVIQGVQRERGEADGIE